MGTEERYSARKRFPSLAEYLDFAGCVGSVLYQLVSATQTLSADSKDEYLLKATVLHFTLKALKTHRAIEHLLERGFVEDATILLRSLLETVISLRYVLLEPSKHARLYQEYDVIVRRRMLRALQKQRSAVGLKPLYGRGDDAEELEREYSRVVGNYPRKTCWSGKTVRDMAHDVCLANQYDLLYRWHSQFVHSTSYTAKHYIQREHHDGLIVDLDPKNEQEYIPFLSEMCTYSIEIATRYEHVFGTGLGTKVDDLVSQFNKLFAGK